MKHRKVVAVRIDNDHDDMIINRTIMVIDPSCLVSHPKKFLKNSYAIKEEYTYLFDGKDFNPKETSYYSFKILSRKSVQKEITRLQEEIKYREQLLEMICDKDIYYIE